MFTHIEFLQSLGTTDIKNSFEIKGIMMGQPVGQASDGTSYQLSRRSVIAGRLGQEAAASGGEKQKPFKLVIRLKNTAGCWNWTVHSFLQECW